MASLNPEFRSKYMSHRLSAFDSLPRGFLMGGFEEKYRTTTNEKLGLISDICAECGNRFERTKEHAYKKIGKNRKKMFCSYRCMRAFDRREEDAKCHKTGGKRGRPSMSREDRIAYEMEKIMENQAALDRCTDQAEVERIKRRIKYHRKALEDLSGKEE